MSTAASTSSSAKPKTAKPKTAKTVAPEPAPVVEPVVVKKEKVAKPKAAKTVEAVPAVVAPVDEATAVEAASVSEIEKCSADLLVKMHECAAMLSSIKAGVKNMDKLYTKDLRAAKKLSKRRSKGGNRAPSGFVKPAKISDDLADFLGKERGSELARTEATKGINVYIKANSLQDKANGRKILPDANLCALFSITPDTDLTYFNLQRYMSRHFVKGGAATV